VGAQRKVTNWKRKNDKEMVEGGGRGRMSKSTRFTVRAGGSRTRGEKGGKHEGHPTCGQTPGKSFPGEQDQYLLERRAVAQSLR